MVIFSGSHQRYYRCSANAKRGTCANKLSVREDIVRTTILDELRKRLTTPEAAEYLRRRIESELTSGSNATATELELCRARLSDFEMRVSNLVDFIAQGDGSPAVRDALRRAETDAAAERARASELAARAQPARTIDVDEVVRTALDVQQMVAREPTRAREALRADFANGRIELRPQPEGHYIAETQLFPLVRVTKEQRPRGRGPSATAIGCAGAILHVGNGFHRANRGAGGMSSLECSAFSPSSGAAVGSFLALMPNRETNVFCSPRCSCTNSEKPRPRDILRFGPSR